VGEKETLLEAVSLAGGKLFLSYLEDAYSKVYQHDLTGNEEKEIALPGIGSVAGFGGRQSDTELFYQFTSFTYPSVIYKYDIPTGTSTVFRKSEIDFDIENYETKQVFYESKDGTRVPMFVVHKKGLKLDGSNPTLLYSYGGFNINMTPSFRVTILPWLEQGGIYAQPCLRGGGEYGEKWHKAGMQENKQNVFDDFIAAAEYLIAEKYTRKEKLAIFGGSNGGLLVGACMTQRPDLFQVALPAVGVMDMLRYHKFTIGWAWAVEYGSSEDPASFHHLYQYSPLHNIKAGVEYPATFITTADHDDRVVPAHSFKFAATLQEKQTGDNPVLIRIATKAGHGAGKPISKVIDEYADVLAFTWYNMGFVPDYGR
jgi:prolyl oligopeptidase